LPDIDKINNVAVANISKLDSITFADGQKVNNQSVSLVTDAHTFISSQTASSSSSLSFTSGIDSTYDVYEWHFINLHSATDNVNLGFQVNATDGADFNDSPITSTFFSAGQTEGGLYGALGYESSFDSAQVSASYTTIGLYFGNQNDESGSGILRLYAPSSTTYVKHWTSEIQVVTRDEYTRVGHSAGYINDTTAIDEISFKMSSGNIDAGEIRMYGVATS
jgi:hypothetical protein